MSYLKSILSLDKIKCKNISFFSIWNENTVLDQSADIRAFTKLYNTKIGKYSRINSGCRLSYVNVKNFTAIGRGSSLGLGQHPLNYASTQNIFYHPNKMKPEWYQPIDYKDEHKEITIGNDVWIGVECLIMDGVTIGDGAVIGARSVVTKDIPPYAIAVGQPAKVLKYRFSPEIINRLLEIKWWDLTDEEISKKIKFFNEPNITIELINKYFK